ncbi:ethanolamine utilization protein EutJ [Lentilactobacillus fungorum]|uniref:Ethanolamine utilization protein EutJ n=1 Tax=Lentilactobacillus fungorum TaxID=2201250 RepID=A0ABQ3VZV1_9LACO|nr:ethanolamine utilization protein EutJ [Lentilactobacillus fungorum]GHP14278.1 ethanolamine utilization protein EutJ [Lentilactobacillus fungorum]
MNMATKQSVDLKAADKRLKQFAKVVNSDHATRKVKSSETLSCGVDLGTSSIVLTVLDQNDQIIYGAFEYAKAVRDGIVVNYVDSVNILKRLKHQAETVLGVELTTACGAIPPGTGDSSAKIVANVIEAAELTCKHVVDEPTAAAKFLNLKTGTVVDIGGGTTGISVFNHGRLTQVLDEATGGFHMTLVLAGNHQINSDDAELLKRDPDKEPEVFPVIRPVVEKMATIVKDSVGNSIKQPVVVVGGAINFKDFIPAFSKVLGMPAYKTVFPQFITPLGIAMYDHD